MLTAGLPAITDPVTIDGYTQPGASPNTLAEGSDAVILIEVRGFQGFTTFGEPVITVAEGPSIIRGLVINGFANTAIMLIDGTGSLVEGNFIGTDPSGMVSGERPGSITSSASAVFTGAASVIGGPDPASRNVISGNNRTGITAGLGTVVQGNYLGTAADGVTLLPNVRNGVEATGQPMIGGRLAVEGNRIAFNGRSGVETVGHGGAFVLSNSIHSNNPGPNSAFGGIAHETAFDDGPLQNNIGDADFWTNYPVLSSAINVGGQGQIAGRINSRPNTELLVQLFSNPVVDLTGHGQGKTYLGSRTVTTGADGNADFIATLDVPLAPGEFITSTATDFSRTTSEFSARLPVGSSLTSDVYIVNTTDDSDDGFCDEAHCTLREAIFAADNHPGRDRIIFNIAPGPARLPRLTEPVVIDGTTQPGYAGTPIIEISGQNVDRNIGGFERGFMVVGGNTEIRGLVINRFFAGAIMLGSGAAPFPLGVLANNFELPGGNVIQNNYIGTDVSGTVALGNSDGIIIASSSDNLIGGGPEARNIISGNGRVGISINGTDQSTRNNVVDGNFIGTDVSGITALGNASADGIIAQDGSGTVLRNNVLRFPRWL